MSKRVALPLAIKAIREARAATDEKYLGSRFAIACGISHSHLSNIEAKRRPPNGDLLQVIAEQLGVDIGAISYVIEQSVAV